MSIAEKLTTINENMERVFATGVAVGKAQGGGDLIDKMLLGQKFELYNDSVTEVGAGAFTMNLNIQRVDLPNVTRIGGGAFAMCSSLTTVNAPLVEALEFDFEATYFAALQGTGIAEAIFPNLTSLTLSSFQSCRNLENVYLPKVTEIPENAFNGCTALKEFDFSNITFVDMYGFQGSGLEEVVIGHDTMLSGNAFSSCDSLIRAKVCSALGSDATNLFSYCDELLVLILTDTVILPSYICRGCKKLKTADLGIVSTINANAFTQCSALEAVILRHPQVCTLSSTNAFTSSGISAKTGYIYVPSGLVDSYKTATNWTTYKTQFRAIEDYPEITGGAV